MYYGDTKGDDRMLDNGKDVTLMTIKPDEQFMKNYQAIYYAMNAKPDCKSKIFGKDVTIKFQDLQDLNNKSCSLTIYF